MGMCQSKLLFRSAKVSKGTHSSQSTVVGDEGPCSEKTETHLPLAFGKDVREEFLFDPDHHNLNHASFGTIPAYIQHRLQHYQTLHERAPDRFIRYDYPKLLDVNREAIAKLINAPSLDEVVFVANATVGVNTVLRGLSETWAPDGKDEILYFSTIYGACGKTVDYVADSTHGRVSGRAIEIVYPIADRAIVAKFRAAVRQAREAEGKRPRVAVFDAVSSLPGVRFPFEAMVSACRELGILSLVDAAQGVGMVDLDVASLDPDFLVSNCHKWLFVPRGCAVFYVPRRNQRLIRSTLPTSHGYVPLGNSTRANPLPPSAKGEFVNNFEYVGTLDNSPYLCVKDAIEWRESHLGGEERIRSYMWTLAKEGGKKMADVLGTWVMEVEEGGARLTDCAMVNIAMPLVVSPDEGSSAPTGTGSSEVMEADVEEAAPVNTFGDMKSLSTGEEPTKVCARDGETVIPYKDAQRIWEWMTKVLVDEYRTFIPVFYFYGRFWARLSAQVYLDMDDFEWAGNTLKVLCERVAKKDYDL